jgi:hypothetical protein
MASEGPPRPEEILSVRVPCREGRERVWRAIARFQQGDRQLQQPRRARPVRRHETRPRRQAGGS